MVVMFFCFFFGQTDLKLAGGGVKQNKHAWVIILHKDTVLISHFPRLEDVHCHCYLTQHVK